MSLKKILSRKTVLKGVGVSMALPLLEIMFPKKIEATEKKPVSRMLAVYFPHGVANEAWYPKEYGEDFELSPSLSPLNPIRRSTSILTGLCHPLMPSGAGHAAAARWLGGVREGDRILNDFASPLQGFSMDQFAVRHIGKYTRVPSMQLSIKSGAGLPARSSTLSFNVRGIPLPSMNNPRAVFNRLFVPESAGGVKAQERRYIQRLSVLDAVMDEARIFKRKLGKSDQNRLDEYFQSVREVEVQINRNKKWLHKPKAKVDPLEINFKTESRSELIKTMYDLIHLAFKTDTTRVITFMAGVEVDKCNWAEMGFKHAYHELQHHNGKKVALERLAAVDKQQVKLFSNFLQKLKATDELESNLLDRSVILYGSGLNNGNGLKNGTGVHGTRNLPLIFAGGKDLGITQGQHLKYESEKVPLCNLFYSMLKALSIPCDSFIDSSGALAGI